MVMCNAHGLADCGGIRNSGQQRATPEKTGRGHLLTDGQVVWEPSASVAFSVLGRPAKGEHRSPGSSASDASVCCKLRGTEGPVGRKHRPVREPEATTMGRTKVPTPNAGRGGGTIESGHPGVHPRAGGRLGP